MAFIKGNKGTVYFSTTKVGEVVGFGINFQGTDITAVSVDSDFTRHAVGSIDCSGTISVLHDPDNAPQESAEVGDEVELHLYANDKVATEQEYTSVGNTQSGKVVITSVGITSAIDAVTTREYGWAGPMLKAVVAS